MTGHFLALHDSGRVRTGTHRTGMSCNRACTVSCFQCFVIVTFDSARKTFTFTGAANVNNVADFKGVGFDDVTRIQSIRIIKFELVKGSFYRGIRFCEMAFLRFVGIFHADLAKAELYSGIAIVFSGLFLDHYTRSGFYNSYRNNLAVVIKNLRHADFLTNDTFFHCLSSYSVIG